MMGDEAAEPRTLRIALVGASQQAEALLRILTGVPAVRVVVVAHPDPDSPALGPARRQGIPVTATYREVFAYGPDIVVDATAAPDVSEELQRSRPPHVELIGAQSVALMQQILGRHIREAHRIEKAETIRRMTGGVYHNLNNLFTTLLGRASLLLDAAKRARAMPAQFTETLEMMNRTLAGGADSLKRLRGLMRDTVEEPVTRLDVGAVVRDVVALAEPLVRESQTRSAPIDLRLSLDDVPPVLGRASELLEVLLNLVVNAIEAMPEGGVLELEAALEEGQVSIRVRDTGVGIPDDVMAKLFTPFFTTKAGGTGLGLNVSREILRGHGGDLTVQSRKGAGTSITIKLPTAETAPAELEGWRVLVADDDGLSRVVVVELLAAIGCRSEGVPGGLAALAALEVASYDLVLLDVFMPDMPGWEVARAIRSRSRETVVGLFTGWDIAPDDPMRRESGADFLLQKPVRLADLLEAVQQAVERRRAQPA